MPPKLVQVTHQVGALRSRHTIFVGDAAFAPSAFNARDRLRWR